VHRELTWTCENLSHTPDTSSTILQSRSIPMATPMPATWFAWKNAPVGEDCPAGFRQTALRTCTQQQPQIRSSAPFRIGSQHGSGDPPFQAVDRRIYRSKRIGIRTAESPRGELGVFLEGDGGPKPYRCYWRTPSFVNLQILPLLSQGHLVADLVALIGTIDIVLGDVDR
jgi:hypothetical protein